MKLFCFVVLQCCCGEVPASCLICRVAVVKLLLVLFDLQCCFGAAPACLFLICRAAAVQLPLAFIFAVLLWYSSCLLFDLPCCCGEAPAPACFLICSVAAMKLLLPF